MTVMDHTGNLIERRALTVADFCQTFSISRSFFYVLLKRGEIHAVLVGGRRLVPVTEGDRLISVAPDDE